MKTYYEQLEPIVLKTLTNFKDDLFVYDRKQLDGYTGKFLYAYRNTGTDLLRSDELVKGLEEIRATGTTNGFFSQVGVQSVLQGQFNIRREFNYIALCPTDMQRNDHFIIGEKGKIRIVTARTMTIHLKELADQCSRMVSEIYQTRTLKQPVPIPA